MKYELMCLETNERITDDYTLHHTDNALLQAQYAPDITVNEGAKGVWQFEDWLPVTRPNHYTAGTFTYKAEALGDALGLSNLWVTFHGHWPERGGLCPTGSFKDMEAVPTIQRLSDHDGQGLICASAGNTARAFTHFCGASNTPLIVVVGKDHAERIWVRADHPTDSVRVVVVEDGDETVPDPESVTATDTEGGNGGAAPTDGSETGPRAIGIVAEEVVGEIVGRAFVRTTSSRAFSNLVRI